MTDPDSRVMKTRQGYVQGYNVQAVVSEDQIIVAVALTQEANDVQQLLPMLEQMNQNLVLPRKGRSCWWPPPRACPELAEGTGSNGRQRGNGAVPEDVSPRTWACGSGWSASCSRNGGGPSTKSGGCWWSRCLAR